ncbi:putative glycogen debranching enzyme, archaeal type [Luteitalea pratensis]|uniref:Putative glycogen debranching enzyme, archaeal type n=1 Tax=Luteitalea pratensis TaxID=1855912 RepID=A0A143PPC0_LUTPR|nr:amylo-alpha-1,6-glucosidase [Luteitalea pratensis]AMY10547.1 putative glycogen debranching enzyme, archaeal type [Luteitalea pratensis]
MTTSIHAPDLLSELVPLVRRVPFVAGETPTLEEHGSREWLVTNGLGGYASGTVTGALTRRFHGLLVAALPSPLGRQMLLTHLEERLTFRDGHREWLGLHGTTGQLAQAEAGRYLEEFRLEAGLPVWRYVVNGAVIEKSLLMPHGQNTVHVTYRLLDGARRVRLSLRPIVGFRPHEAPVDRSPVDGYTVSVRGQRIEVAADEQRPALRLVLHAPTGGFSLDDQAIHDVRYLVEERRGYDFAGPLWSPGRFRTDLLQGTPVTVIASAESWDMLSAVNPEGARAMERARRARLLCMARPAVRSGVGAELVLAADQFLMTPISRTHDQVRAEASGGHARSVIAGYHWFTDWGRDTMISLEGLTLCTGRVDEARDILRTFAYHVRDGLIPNMFPEGGQEGLYHTADATLWFFHAVDRYHRYTHDDLLLRELLPTLRRIVDAHREGTRFGIGVDPADGLLRQGAEGYQLTWMDAKVDGWVVTPRRGKAVEINALWYNAVSLLAGWLRGGDHDADADGLAEYAAQVRATFNARFWNDGSGCLFDVVDGESGDDPACRPNQVFAMSLRHPVLEPQHWDAVLETVRRELLTPVGLRSLSPAHPDYKRQYFGDLRTRDAAYHQGTVWSWLIGPFIDAWLARHPDDAEGARRFVAPALAHLDQGCVGSVSEVFDAEAPYAPRGCIAQAWGVAEWLRAWDRTATPPRPSR